jgi:hypothetical protein
MCVQGPTGVNVFGSTPAACLDCFRLRRALDRNLDCGRGVDADGHEREEGTGKTWLLPPITALRLPAAAEVRRL